MSHAHAQPDSGARLRMLRTERGGAPRSAPQLCVMGCYSLQTLVCGGLKPSRWRTVLRAKLHTVCQCPSQEVVCGAHIKHSVAMQVATQQLQIRKADMDAEASSVRIRSLQAELQVWCLSILAIIHFS